MRNIEQHNLFVNTKPGRLFLKAALPGAIGMLASAMYQTLDGVFVGRFLGSTAFAAINLAMPFVIINFSLADLIGVGSSVPISIALGEGRGEDANKIFSLAIVLIFLADKDLYFSCYYHFCKLLSVKRCIYHIFVYVMQL